MLAGRSSSGGRVSRTDSPSGRYLAPMTETEIQAMRIHTHATRADVYAAARAAGAAVLADVSEHGSRTHARAFEVHLSGTGARRNTGTRGASDEYGATWDEWGIFLAHLYRVDPGARCGGSVKRPVYADADDYRHQTGGRFDTLTPDAQHARHRWEYVAPREHACKCGAVNRWSERDTAAAA